MGIARGKFDSSVLGAVQSGIGRFLPAAVAEASPAPEGVIGYMVSAAAQRQPQE